jgi:hypothetical protein
VRLTTAPKEEEHIPETWSPDGRHLLFSVLKGTPQKGGTYTLWALSVADGKTMPFGDIESHEPTGAVFSPDGHWVAYHSLPSGAAPVDTSSGVFVEPFPATGTRYQPPKINRDFQPVWSRNGAELLFVASTATGRLEAVPVTLNAGVFFDKPQYFPFLAYAGRLSVHTRAFDALPNDRFIGMISGAAGDGTLAPNSEMYIVFNWFEELKSPSTDVSCVTRSTSISIAG